MIDLLKDVVIDFKYIVRDYKANTIVYAEDDILNEVGIILMGEVNIYTSTINGFDFEINILPKGTIFGDTLIFKSEAKLPGTIVCKGETKIMFINKTVFLKTLENNHTFLENYLRYNAFRNIEHQNKIKLLGQPSIREKILYYLKEEIKKQGRKTVMLNMNKEQLSVYLGLNRPSLSRELQRMKIDGLIDYNRKTITYLK